MILAAPATPRLKQLSRRKNSIAGSLDQLLDLAQRDEEGGLGDAPWPPHFAKQRGEPKRVQPSRAKKAGVGTKNRQ